MLRNPASKVKRSINDDGSFDEQLRSANELLKNVRDADTTMRLLEQLHSMQEEIRDELLLEQETNSEETMAVAMLYVCSKKPQLYGTLIPASTLEKHKQPAGCAMILTATESYQTLNTPSVDGITTQHEQR
ncbi:hypothetical protein KIN20_024300 [Parelaphostrongylus tenuis]|uniref:Uncharacterized protein n=1 Tax=Parelaphostrongylus tenuis TaxID=148309 RepID=A0AAD5NAX7_PARTN|nr:hypothetical protein KIN20_024300 [Parelaphostrongylus tenuis]